MQLDLNGLETVEAVVKYGGFGRAAQHLNKVQSAVSHQVRKLEEQLGIALFDRQGYRVRLTPAGEAIMQEGRRLLAQAQSVRSAARQFSQGWEPSLLFVIDGILPLEPTLAALKALALEQVPTRIQVKVGYLRGVQAQFEKENGDLMLVTDHAADPNLREEALPPVDCVLCIAPGHPLASARSVSLAELSQLVELSVQLSSDEQGFDRHLFGCERSFYLSSFQMKKEALLMGVGFGWMPLYFVKDELGTGALRELRYVGGSRYQVTPLLIHRANRHLGRAATRVIELLRGATWPQTSARRRKR
jgi:DNA-binding transcriptional LysR family regulator